MSYCTYIPNMTEPSKSLHKKYHVSVVGILDADAMMNFPDFRAYERAFQLMAQVSGRAGRKNKRGRVILQTRNITHPIIAEVIDNDFKRMSVDFFAKSTKKNTCMEKKV